MGKIELDHTGSGGGVTLSSDGTDLLLDGTAIGGGGGGADLYAANESSPAAQPSATGANAVAIGDSAISSGEDAFAGPLSRAAGTHSVALGIANNGSSYGAGGSYAVSLGFQSRAMALQSVALGSGAYVDSDSSRGFALGENSFVQQCDYGLAIGALARVHGGNSATEATAFGSSYASGTSSFAAAIANNTSSYGAKGANSIVMGYQCKSTGANGVSLGQNNIVSGNNATAIGYFNTASGYYTTALGYDNTTSAAFGHAIGYQAVSSVNGKGAYASGAFSLDGDAQGGMYILRADTTDATAEALTTNNSTAGSTNQIVAASDTCITFDGTITAMQNGAQAYASWKIEGLLVNDGGTTTLANSATTVIQNSSNWGMALSADNTNNALAITCTGEAAHNIRWVANIRTTECTFA